MIINSQFSPCVSQCYFRNIFKVIYYFNMHSLVLYSLLKVSLVAISRCNLSIDATKFQTFLSKYLQAEIGRFLKCCSRSCILSFRFILSWFIKQSSYFFHIDLVCHFLSWKRIHSRQSKTIEAKALCKEY